MTIYKQLLEAAKPAGEFQPQTQVVELNFALGLVDAGEAKKEIQPASEAENVEKSCTNCKRYRDRQEGWVRACLPCWEWSEWIQKESTGNMDGVCPMCNRKFDVKETTGKIIHIAVIVHMRHAIRAISRAVAAIMVHILKNKRRSNGHKQREILQID